MIKPGFCGCFDRGIEAGLSYIGSTVEEGSDLGLTYAEARLANPSRSNPAEVHGLLRHRAGLVESVDMTGGVCVRFTANKGTW